MFASSASPAPQPKKAKTMEIFRFADHFGNLDDYIEYKVDGFMRNEHGDLEPMTIVMPARIQIDEHIFNGIMVRRLGWYYKSMLN